MRVQYEDMINEFKRVFLKRGMNETDSYEAAQLFAQNSLDGVYSHGVNRFINVINYIDKGYIDVSAKLEYVDGHGSLERWDANLGLGVLSAKRAMARAIEIAKESGVGVVGLKNTNHWMRGGSYGWQAANEGCIGICWTNTMPNMPPWGALNSKIGNNPFVMSAPKSSGEHLVLDTAMSQFSYGKIAEYKNKELNLPVDGGFDTKGNLTTNPKEIEKTGRVIPIGFWKGSGMSIMLDLIATMLSGGLSTHKIGEQSKDEYGISQVFIAIDPTKLSSQSITDKLIDDLISDLKSAEPIGNENIRYPGEGSRLKRAENLAKGIPVQEEIWDKIKLL